jgi:hypothetical protein
MIELAREIAGMELGKVIALLAFAAFAVAWKALSVLEAHSKKKEKDN